MTPEEKSRLATMCREELYHILLRDLRKAEATVMLEVTLERLPGTAMPKLEKALDGIRKAIKLTKQLLERGDG